MIISVNGNIGSGKSSILKKLDKLGYKVYLEGINRDAWGDFLSKFYDAPSTYSFSFQTVVLADMSKLLEKIINDDDDDIVFIERSVIDCYAFAKLHYNSGNMSETEFSTFKYLYKKLALFPDYNIYLDVDSKTCIDRISFRGRDCESAVSIDYIKDVEKVTKDMLVTSMIKNIYIDCNKKCIDTIVLELVNLLNNKLFN
jgi:deoxyadenosine/deoxycytidine kinase